MSHVYSNDRGTVEMPTEIIVKFDVKVSLDGDVVRVYVKNNCIAEIFETNYVDNGQVAGYFYCGRPFKELHAAIAEALSDWEDQVRNYMDR